MRRCGYCGAALHHEGGEEDPRGGNRIEIDEHRCRGCGRRFKHVVRERFSGNDESWSEWSGSGWKALPEARWPRLGGGG